MVDRSRPARPQFQTCGYDSYQGHGIAEHVRAGRKTQVPMGILCVGPMGTGKSWQKPSPTKVVFLPLS